MKLWKRNIWMAALILMMGVSLLSMQACTSGTAGNKDTATPTPTPTPSSTPEPIPSSSGANELRVDGEKNPVVTIEMENGKTIVLVLYPDKAPNTVNNFISLVQDKFYDGLTFHRVAKDFMIQGGDPQGTGTGGPGYSIKGEFEQNGFSGNDISHVPGVISMARSQSMDSAGSQFFICSGDASFLDGSYASFGMVTSGLDEVYAMAALNTQPNGGPPSSPLLIKTITVDTFGVEYPKPETIKE